MGHPIGFFLNLVSVERLESCRQFYSWKEMRPQRMADRASLTA